MTATRNRSMEFGHVGNLETLEFLVDELIKDKPREQRIRRFMEAVGLSYVADPIERMNRVLSALDRIQGAAKRRGRENDKST